MQKYDCTVIRWHWDTLFSLYKSWTRQSDLTSGVVQRWESLIEPLQMIGIYPATDKGRVKINSARKPGFVISRDSLIESIRKFLEKLSDQEAAEWTPPKEEPLFEDDD
jgi:hypothetical protein